MNPSPGTSNPAPLRLRSGQAGTRHPEPDPPLVSIVIPCLNEAEHIEQLLEAIRMQDESPFEVVIVDGGSTDDTLAIVERYRARHPEMRVRSIALPGGGIPVSLNAGIRAATGEFIARLDAHSHPRCDYLRRLAHLLRTSGAGVVGGRWEIEPGSPTDVGRAIAWAGQHPLGAGDAAYRIRDDQGRVVPVDTVPFGCFEKSLWEALGGFNEDLLTNEDYEFNYRARRAGRDVLLDPSVVCVYVARGSLGGLARQYFRYGWWKLAMLKRNPESLRWRQAVPMLFVTGVGVLAVGSFWSASFLWWLAALLIPYIAVVGLSSARIAHRRRAWRALPVLPAVFVVIHFAWGLGALANGLTFGRWPPRVAPGR
jgi:glycosyltransferase involved in cell wall biosynthesis